MASADDIQQDIAASLAELSALVGRSITKQPAERLTVINAAAEKLKGVRSKVRKLSIILLEDIHRDDSDSTEEGPATPATVAQTPISPRYNLQEPRLTQEGCEHYCHSAQPPRLENCPICHQDPRVVRRS